MSPMAAFIARPVATTLLTLGMALAGLLAYFQLPVAPLPQVEFPTISVQASLPGASPETMAATVATPLERALGAIAGVTEMTSFSSQGNTRVTLQFELDRDINGAANDVQAAINAARPLLPTGMPSNPTYRKVNPADAPIVTLALTSETVALRALSDLADTACDAALAFDPLSSQGIFNALYSGMRAGEAAVTAGAPGSAERSAGPRCHRPVRCRL